ncbi:hypothetical protein LguiA_028091 [Lonicera macranthoides]
MRQYRSSRRLFTADWISALPDGILVIIFFTLPGRAESFACIISKAEAFRDSQLPPCEVFRNFCRKSYHNSAQEHPSAFDFALSDSKALIGLGHKDDQCSDPSSILLSSAVCSFPPISYVQESQVIGIVRLAGETQTSKKERREEAHSAQMSCLTVVKLRHFRGGTKDVELATYLFTNAHSLEMIAVDTRDPYRVGTPFEVLEKENLSAKELAVNLASKLSPGVRIRSTFEAGLGIVCCYIF